MGYAAVMSFVPGRARRARPRPRRSRSRPGPGRLGPSDDHLGRRRRRRRLRPVGQRRRARAGTARRSPTRPSTIHVERLGSRATRRRPRQPDPAIDPTSRDGFERKYPATPASTMRRARDLRHDAPPRARLTGTERDHWSPADVLRRVQAPAARHRPGRDRRTGSTSLDQVVDQEGESRARFLLYKLLKRARQLHVGLPPLTQTRYINTISPEQEPFFPGDEAARAPDPPAHPLERGGDGPAGQQPVLGDRRAPRDVRLGGDPLRGRLQPLLPGQGRRRPAATRSSTRATPRRGSTPGRSSRAA